MPPLTCTRCSLSEHRAQVVPSTGPLRTTLLFVGEAPGGTEDTNGLAFSGQAGKLFQNLLDTAGIDLGVCAFTYTVGCRPPNNRTPKPPELAACWPWLVLDVARRFKPQVIVAVGQTALEVLLGQARTDPKWARHLEYPIAQHHGAQAGELLGIPVWVVHHPSAGLRNNSQRRLLAGDLTALAAHLGITQSPPATDVLVTSAVGLLMDLLVDMPAQLAVDTETDGRWEGIADLLGVGLSWRRPDGTVRARYCPGASAVPLLARIQEDLDYSPELVLHNAKFDARILRRYGWSIWTHPVQDTQVMAYVLRRGQFVGSTGLKELLPVDTGFHISSLAVLGSPTELDTQTLGVYCAQDAAATLRLGEEYLRRLELDPRLSYVYQRLDRPVIEVTATMEDTGFHLDLEALAVAEATAQEQQARTEATLACAGLSNPNSSAQVKALLYGQLKLPVLEHTPSGQPSTDSKTLRSLLALPEMPGEPKEVVTDLLAHREANKLLTGFISTLPANIQPTTGRVHTHFNHAFVETGRFSSSQPVNFQNIPGRTKLGKAVRRAMSAPPGSVLIKADYSQVEMRVLAAFSRDPALLLAFDEQIDVHVATAAAMLGIPVHQVTSEQRAQGKQLNFATVYGQGPGALAASLHIETAQAKALLQTYWNKLPAVASWIAWAQEDARDRGYAETWFGRRNYYPDLADPRKWVRSKSERESVNMRIQGTAADIMRMFMRQAFEKVVRPGLAEMPAQVHDELVFFCVPEMAQDLAVLIKDLGEGVADIGVPVLLDIKIGQNWADVEEIKEEYEDADEAA